MQSITPNSNTAAAVRQRDGCQLGVWRTTDGGTTWTHGRLGRRFAHATATDRGHGDYPQNWYDQGMAVDPNNPDRVFFDTFDVWFASRTGTAVQRH